MTPQERKRIELFLRACPTDAVRAVAEEPPEKWRCGAAIGSDGRRCLTGIAGGVWLGRFGITHRRWPESWIAGAEWRIARKFDCACWRDGLPATVAEVRKVALGVLADRAAKG